MPKMSGVILRHGVSRSDNKVLSKKVVHETYEKLKKRGYDVYLNEEGHLCARDMDTRDIKNELSVIDDGSSRNITI